MKNKLLTFIITGCIFAVGVLTGRASTAVRAGSWDSLVYSVNDTAGDSDGNVDVTSVNGYTVNSSVPATTNFAQYDQNTTDIVAIKNRLSGLTATDADVASGKTFVGTGGNIATGTLNTGSGEMERVFYQGPTWNGSSYTFSQDCSFAAISAAAGKQNGSGLSLGISISGTYTLVEDTGYQDLNGGNGQGGRYRSMLIKDIKAGTVVSFSGFFQYAANVYILS